MKQPKKNSWLKRLREIAREEPLWLSIVLIVINIALTSLNITLIIAKLKGLL